VTPRQVSTYADVASLSRGAADAIADAAHRAVAARGRFTIALSGGSTPRALYGLLATEYQQRIPWTATHVFFGDERCVPPDHPESNFGMARGSLIAHIPGLDARTHRIAGERPAADAAAQYDAELHAAFPGDDPTTFDVLLLGIGPDGHTASLFPGSPVLRERVRWAAAAEAPPSATTRARVTLTLPVLDASRDLLLLCAGADKRPILERIRAAGASAGDLFPAARVTAREHVRWLLDRSAASDAGAMETGQN
jgi:6-phosphogluconolactonase